MTLTTAAVLAQRKSSIAPKSIDPPSATFAAAQNRDVVTAPAPEAAPSASVAVPQANAAATKDNAVRTPQAKAAAPLTISVEPSQVRADDHFAEIRLRRNLLQKNGSFTWWTEPATAKPGVDYVPEAVAIQTFPEGYRATRLYVRLLPQAMRSQRSYFYIAIAQTGPHQAPATVIRRQVWLPTSSSLQAQR